MSVTSSARELLLTTLAATPQRLTAMTSDLDHAQLHASPTDDAWSINEILGHLRACAEVWGKSILVMIDQDHPTLRYVSPRTQMRKANYAAQEFQPSLQTFTEQRAALIQALTALDSAGWARGATFTGTTRGRSQTVFSYAQRIAEHETQHLAQVAAVVRAIQI